MGYSQNGSHTSSSTFRFHHTLIIIPSFITTRSLAKHRGWLQAWTSSCPSVPPPIGAKKANLDPSVREIIKEFAYQEVGHIRVIKKTVHGFPRPQLNLTAANFGSIMNAALNTTLKPPFNPYANSVNYLLASYLIPYVGLTGYVGTNPHLQSATAKRLVAGLLGVESGQDAVIRALLYERLFEKVAPC